MAEHYLTADALTVGDKILITFNGPFEKDPRTVWLSVEEFKSLYRMVFTMIQEELNKKTDDITRH